MSERDNEKTNLSGPDIKGLINDNVVQPFQLERPQFRGRMVRLGSVLNEIIDPHQFPLALESLMTEALTVTTLLAGMLKYDGVFTFQISGEGAVKTLVSDITHNGTLRGYASYSHEGLEKVVESSGQDPTELTSKKLTGDGRLAFTVEQTSKNKRYQGIVELEGQTLVDSVQHYFRQSEQIKTGIKYFADYDPETKQWSAAAIMLQSLPDEEDNEHLQGQTNIVTDDWRRIMMLLDTATREEMTDRELPVNDMIFRLFHEEEIRVFDPISIHKGCRCSEEKVVSVLTQSVPEEEIDEFIEDGRIYMDCEFCKTRYEFDREELDALYSKE